MKPELKRALVVGPQQRGVTKHLVRRSHGYYTTTVELTSRPFLGRLCNTGKSLAPQDYCCTSPASFGPTYGESTKSPGAKRKNVFLSRPWRFGAFAIRGSKTGWTTVAQGGWSRSHAFKKWPTQLLFTVYFTYTS